MKQRMEAKGGEYDIKVRTSEMMVVDEQGMSFVW